MISKERIEEIKSGYSADSGTEVKEFSVSLANGEKIRVFAENIAVRRSGALEGILYDPDHTSKETSMAEDALWTLAPGQWIYVERI